MPSNTVLCKTNEDSLRLFSVISKLIEKPASMLAFPRDKIKHSFTTSNKNVTD